MPAAALPIALRSPEPWQTADPRREGSAVAGCSAAFVWMDASLDRKRLGRLCERARFRSEAFSIRQEEAADVCGGRGARWDLNRLWFGSYCIERSCVRSPSWMLINILLTSLSMFASS